MIAFQFEWPNVIINYAYLKQYEYRFYETTFPKGIVKFMINFKSSLGDHIFIQQNELLWFLHLVMEFLLICAILGAYLAVHIVIEGKESDGIENGEILQDRSIIWGDVWVEFPLSDHKMAGNDDVDNGSHDER